MSEVPSSVSSTQQPTLSKLAYHQLRAQLEFRPNPWMNIATLVVNALLLGLSAYLLLSGSAWAYWLAQLLLPIVFFQAFSLLHDCGHGSCTTSRIGNAIIGHYASLWCFMPFFPWKYIHTEHHVWAGNPERDPGLALVQRARTTRKLPRLLTAGWRIWLPIAGLAQHVVYWTYPITAFRRGVLSRSKQLRCAASVAWLLGAYIAFHFAAPRLFNWMNVVPAVFFYLMLVEIVNFPHHVGLTSFSERLPLWRQHLPTRTCYYPVVISELLVLNFNFHIEHHLFPNLPWYRLRAARQLVKPVLGDQYRETHGMEWHIRARKRRLVDVLCATD